MSESTKRAIRTAYQFLVALGPIIVTLLTVVPADSSLAVKLVVVAGWHTAATKVLNELEDRGVIPAWLK